MINILFCFFQDFMVIEIVLLIDKYIIDKINCD